MRFINLLIGFSVTSDALSLVNIVEDSSNVPNKEQAASIARTLVNRESLMNVNTLKTDNTESIPVSAMEYYADCDSDGDPYWLIVDIGSTYQNIVKGSKYSFTIRVGDHPLNDYVNPNYPGGIVNSPAGSPRINLKGQMKEVDLYEPSELLRIEKCFLDKHPDAKWWLPSNIVTPHKTHWAKISVSEVYMVGGFGDRAYIGVIDSETYHSSSLLDD